MKYKDLPWAVKTSKHIECQQAIVELLDNDDDQGAGILQNFIEHDRLKAWAWQDANNEAFPILGGAHGHAYWGTPNTTRVSELLLHAQHALNLDYSWDTPSSIHYHYPISTIKGISRQATITPFASPLGYALKDLEQTLGHPHTLTSKQSLQHQNEANKASDDSDQTRLSILFDAEDSDDAVPVLGHNAANTKVSDQTNAETVQQVSQQAIDGSNILPEHQALNHYSTAGKQTLTQSPSFFENLRNGGVDIVHSGFCFGGAGELLSDYSGHDYPPHDCSSSVSHWFHCPFRISTGDQYLLSVYPKPIRYLGWLHLAPINWVVPRLDRLSFFDGKLQRAQQLANTLVSVPNEDVQPGDMYVMRITKPNPNWSGYFFGQAGHTAMVKQKSPNKPDHVETIEFSRAIEDGIEGFGLGERPLFPEVSANGNQISHTLLRKL